jgi:hypothetical protein
MNREFLGAYAHEYDCGGSCYEPLVRQPLKPLNNTTVDREETNQRLRGE